MVYSARGSGFKPTSDHTFKMQSTHLQLQTGHWKPKCKMYCNMQNSLWLAKYNLKINTQIQNAIWNNKSKE